MQKRLVRTSNDKVIAGVCGGLAQYLGVDSTVVRLVFLLSVLILNVLHPVIYLIFWLVMPLDSEQISAIPPQALPRQQDPTGEWRYDPYTGQPVERTEEQRHG